MSRPEPIPVRMMRCSEVIDCPGIGVAHGCTAGAKHRLEYWPWMRHHRIEFVHDPSKPPIVSFVHETKVAFWQPLDAVSVPAAAASPPARK